MANKRLLNQEMIEAAEELALTGPERAFAALSKRFLLAPTTPRGWYYKGSRLAKRENDPKLCDHDRLCIAFFRAMQRGMQRGPLVLKPVLPAELVAQLTR